MNWLAAAVGALVVSGLVGWAFIEVVRQQGRLLLAIDHLQTRLAELEQRAQTVLEPGSPPVPLSPGSRAPDFVLPELKGGVRTMADYRRRPVALVFFDPRCGFCAQLAPWLSEHGDGKRQLVVMTRGDMAANQRFAEAHDWRADVLLEPDWKVAATFGVHATPTAFLIDSDGRIASELASGVEGVIELLSSHEALTSDSLRQHQQSAVERARTNGLAITPSRISRNGLRQGTLAPDFTRQDLEGARRSISAMKGRPLLLVFSDPACGPCQEFAPSLQRLYEARRNDGLQVLMVSRGDAATNVHKVREHGLTFPVVLQDSWEISKEYAIFATPVGYLIDPNGAIASPVAVGGDAILNLVRVDELAMIP